jgi:uncharacterized cupredoxin-like copper-binding protein/plastocyanin
MKRYVFPVIFLSFFLLVLSACGNSAPIPSTTSAATKTQTITIPIGDFYIHSPQTTLLAGIHYHFVVTNVGKHHHDFLIMHQMMTETMIMDDVYKHALSYIYNIAPGQTKTLDFVFDHTAPAGMLELSCHYGGHWEAGMHQPIIVDAAPGSSVTSYPNSGIPLNADASVSTTNMGSKCDAPVTATIGSNAAYKQSSVSLKKGDTLTIVNTTQQSFTLTTKPDAGIRFTTVDPGETEYVPFPNPGTFTLSSQEHPQDTLAVQVASTAGITCGFTPVATVNFDANYTNPQQQYFFIPTMVTIKEGQSITLSNLADANLTFESHPDANLGDIALDRNEHQLLFFSDNGTYTISCQQFPNETFTVVVQDSGDDDS